MVAHFMEVENRQQIRDAESLSDITLSHALGHAQDVPAQVLRSRMQIRQISRMHELDLLTAARSMNAFSWPGTDFGARQRRLQGQSTSTAQIAYAVARFSALLASFRQRESSFAASIIRSVQRRGSPRRADALCCKK